MGPTGLDVALEPLLVLGAKTLRNDEPRQFAAHRFVRGPAEHGRGASVPAGHDALAVHEDVRIERVVDDQAGAGLGIVGHEIEIIAVRACRFGVFLSVQALCQSSARFRPIRLNFQSTPEFCFCFFRFALSKCAPPQVIDGRNVVGIQMQQRLERFRCASSITRAVLRHCQQISGPALCRKQFDRFAERRYRGGVFLFVEKHHPQIEIGFGHFWIDSDGPPVFGASLVRFLQRGIDVSELKVCVGKAGLIRDDFL